MKNEVCKTYEIKIYMAGDISLAKALLQQYVDDVGLCVTIEPLTYVYTKGKEEGFRIGLINYPRFPSTMPELDLLGHAKWIVAFIREPLGQKSFSIVCPDYTYWQSHKDEDDNDTKIS